MIYRTATIIGIGGTPEAASEYAQTMLDAWGREHSDQTPITHNTVVTLLTQGPREFIMIVHVIGWVE